MASWSEADDASFLSNAYGLAPDPWQHLVLTDWLGRQPSGKWSASRCGLAVPRQNGKNGVLEIRELFGLIVLGEKFLHTAHEVKTARKAFKRLQHFFGETRNDPGARFPDLNALVREVRSTNGQEAIVLNDIYDEDGNFVRAGGSVEFVARSRGSGRGYTVDVLVLDEAQELTDEQLEALQSTVSSAPSGNPQTILTGTPPGPGSPGEVFARVRKSGHAGGNGRLSWIEWALHEGADLYLPSNWALGNPALGLRLQRSVIEDELPPDGLSEAGFKRERLGVWASTSRGEVKPLLDQGVWAGLEANPVDRPVVDAKPAALGVDMSHDGVLVVDGAWIVPGGVFVEVLALDTTQAPPDDDWSEDPAVTWIADRAGKRMPVVIDAESPAAALIPALRARRVRLIITGPSDMAKACQGWHRDATAGRFFHAGQQQLTDAFAGARKRSIGNAGGWGLDRKDPAAFIAPGVAAVLARFGAVSTYRPKTGDREDSGSGRRAVVL